MDWVVFPTLFNVIIIRYYNNTIIPLGSRFTNNSLLTPAPRTEDLRLLSEVRAHEFPHWHGVASPETGLKGPTNAPFTGRKLPGILMPLGRRGGVTRLSPFAVWSGNN